MYRHLIIVPVFNEYRRLNETYFESIQNPAIDVLFVNDGSTDKTDEKINAILKTKQNFKKLDLGANFGKAEAVRKGINFGLQNKDYISVSFLDADGAFEIDEIQSKILELGAYLQCAFNQNLCSNTAYFTSRVQLSGSRIERSLVRHYLSRILLTLIFMGHNNFPYDSQAGFKIFPACIHTQKIFNVKFSTRWFFDIEIFLRTMNEENGRMQVVEIPIKSWKEIGGSNIRVKTIPTLFSEMLKIRIQINKSSRINRY